MNQRLGRARYSAYVSLVLAGAIFGFFYAWVCSTMWGLDAADPRVAIAAMQEMNASVRNAVFFPAFFVTPVALGISGALAWRARRRRAVSYFLLAGVVYLIGGLLLTLVVNVPMNEDLARTTVPTSIEQARQIWDEYSRAWQMWNIVRTVCSGLSLVLAAIGLTALARQQDQHPTPPAEKDSRGSRLQQALAVIP